jgi:hypothetical protein
MNMLILALTLLAQPGEPKPVLRPSSPDQFYVEPAVDAVLRWEVTSGTLTDPVDVIVRDYRGSEVTRVRASRPGPRLLEAKLRVERGYLELEVPSGGQRFGLLALDPNPVRTGAATPRDPFFAIDGAQSWLVRDDKVRDALVAACARSGIGMVRERLTSGAVHPSADRWVWDTPQRFEALRQNYQRRGVEVLEMAHDTPRWFERIGPYPADLEAFAQLWQGLAGRWRPTWGAVEVWNEPDIQFGGDLPADQYVPLAKTLAYAFTEAHVDAPLVGGATAYFRPAWLDAAGQGLLLDRVDVLSFHTYGSALQMEPLVADFRAWLRTHGHGDMPLWITECGRPWDKGPDRPPVNQDARSALDIVMKGVEARACGVDRYFPFVLPFYEENSNNFGMTDRRASPLRSFAAYAAMVQVLGHGRYVGDLAQDDKLVKRARGFRVGKVDVAVVYTGTVDPKAVVKLGTPVRSARGIDGRSIKIAADGAIPVPDGLVYVELDAQLGPPRLVTDTAASRLVPTASESLKLTRTSSPIVLRYLFDPKKTKPTSDGYRLDAEPGAKLPVTFRVVNLGGKEHTLRVGLRVKSGTATRELPSKAVTVSGRASADLAWDLDTSGLFDSSDRVTIVAEASDGTGLRDRLAVGLMGEPDLQRVLKQNPGAIRLPISELARWTPAHSPGDVTMEAAPGTYWRMKVNQPGRGDHWAYPAFRLPDDLRLDRESTFLIRARCHGQASVRMFLWEGEGNVGYITPGSLAPGDDRWHVARVRPTDLIASMANAPDPDGRLDPAAVRRLSLGMNARTGEATLDVSDVYVIPTARP